MGRSSSEGLPRAHGRTSCRSPECKQWGPHPCNALWYSYLPLGPSPSCSQSRRSCPSTPGVAGENEHSFSTLLFLDGIGHHHLIVQVCALLQWERSTLGRLFLPSPLLPHICVYTWFSPMACEDLPLRIWTSEMSFSPMAAQVSAPRVFSWCWLKGLCCSTSSRAWAGKGPLDRKVASVLKAHKVPRRWETWEA